MFRWPETTVVALQAVGQAQVHLEYRLLLLRLPQEAVPVATVPAVAVQERPPQQLL